MEICDEALLRLQASLRSKDIEVRSDTESFIGSFCDLCESLSASEEEGSEALISRSFYVGLSDWEGMFVVFVSILVAAS